MAKNPPLSGVRLSPENLGTVTTARGYRSAETVRRENAALLAQEATRVQGHTRERTAR